MAGRQKPQQNNMSWVIVYLCF